MPPFLEGDQQFACWLQSLSYAFSVTAKHPFFEKYFGIGNRSFTSEPEKQDEDEKKVTYYDFSAPPIGMVAEEPAQYGIKKDDGE